MNPYEERQEAKRERLRKAAAKRRAEATAKYDAGTKALEAIPFGQPILVGHHSEKGDRAYRDRAVARIEQSFELSTEAGKLEARADAIGTRGISSDDPEALAKLQDKLLQLEEAHTHMIERNKEARAIGTETPYFAYQLTNSGANIRRIKMRIARLERTRNAPAMQPMYGNGWEMFEEKDSNRIIIKFADRPAPELCKSLRSYGFLWSPSRGAWVRNAINASFAVSRAFQLLSAL